MSRRARKQLLDDATAVIAWIGLVAAIVAMAGYPQAWGVAAASLIIQIARGQLR
jgi:hypothetical protein